MGCYTLWTFDVNFFGWLNFINVVFTRSVDIHDCEAMYHVTSQQTAFCLFVCIVAFVPVNSYGHCGMVSSPNHAHFFLGKLEQAVNQYFVHILSLVADHNPS